MLRRLPAFAWIGALAASAAGAQVTADDSPSRGLSVRSDHPAVSARNAAPQGGAQPAGLSAEQCARLLDRAARDPALAMLAAGRGCTRVAHRTTTAGVETHDLPGKARQAPPNVRAGDMAAKQGPPPRPPASSQAPR